MTPFPIPLRKPTNEAERLYFLAYLRCMSAAWHLAGDPNRHWQGVIVTTSQAFAQELVEGAEVYLKTRADVMSSSEATA